MCGIVGVIAKTTTGLMKTGEDTFLQLLYANALRGDDSTGLICVEKDSTFHIAKQASEAAWFTPQYTASDVYKSMWSKGKAYIGHNRKKTVGKVAHETAHPFVVNDEFAMVHNGTLYNHKALADTEVDSEALSQVIAKAFENDVYMPSLEETLGRVHGAYAVAMYDQRHHAVRMLRNKERPLSYVETQNAWFFASEAPMLFWILARNGYSANELKIQAVPEHTLLTFDLDKNEMKSEVVVPKKPIPSTKATSAAGTGATTVMTVKKSTKQMEGMSKNAYKRFRRKFLGKKLEWWVEDYVETNFPRTEQDGETKFNLMGVCDDLLEDHMIVSTVDLKELNLLSNELIERLWVGRVSEMSYDTKTRVISMTLMDALPLPVSLRHDKKPVEVIDAEYIRRKLEEKELDEAEKALVTLH
jgi:glucosamine 6-phosphate synthetase-like amidotransferase/phosphosugar isomerase protein